MYRYFFPTPVWDFVWHHISPLSIILYECLRRVTSKAPACCPPDLLHSFKFLEDPARRDRIVVGVVLTSLKEKARAFRISACELSLSAPPAAYLKWSNTSLRASAGLVIARP
jgi:hypothetical protein